MSSRIVQNLLVFAVAAGVLLCAYSRALNGGMLMDDDNLIYESSVMHGPNAIERIWLDIDATSDFYPFTHMSWWLDFRIAEAFGVPERINVIIHVENVLMHALSAMLVWIIARRLGISAWGAALAAGIFALHPVQVESVAWMSQRKNTLSGLFYLLSAYGFIRGVMETERVEKKWYALALGMFACALFAKPRVMTLAASVVVLTWWKGGALWKRRAVRAWPMFALAMPMAAWTMHVQKTHVGTAMEIFNHSLIERCVIAGKVFMFSLGKLVWPTDLSFAYHLWSIDISQTMNWLPVVGSFVLVGAAWGVQRWIGRGVLATLSHVAISLSPSLGFISIYWQRYYWTADHEQYLGVIGFALLIGGAIESLMMRGTLLRVGVTKSAAIERDRAKNLMAGDARGLHKNKSKNKKTNTSRTESQIFVDSEAKAGIQRVPRQAGWRMDAGAGAIAVLLGIYGVLSWRQARLYDDAIDLWEAVVQEDPTSIIANRSLGRWYHDEGKYDLALEHAMRAIEAGDDSAEGYLNLSGALGGLGRHEESKAAAEKALFVHEHGRVDQRSQKVGRIHFNYGTELMSLGQIPEAISELRLATKLEPTLAEAWYNLGNSYRKVKRNDEAVEAYEHAVEVKPGFAEAWVNMGVVLRDLGRIDEARKAWEQGLNVAKQGSEAERIAKERLK